MLRLLLTALLFVEHTKDVVSGPLQGDKKAAAAAQDNWFTRVLHYMKSNPETLEELMSKDRAVMQGDVLVLEDRNAVESIWPTPQIPYVISPELAGRKDVLLSAMAMVSEHTCVSFHERTSETNYLHFLKGKGCASYVGMIGGEQAVFIGPLCAVGNMVHEILHALGFHHEHTREDREQYIKVISHNIMEGMEKNFKKHHGQTFDLRYDTSSILHYGSGFFSANGLPTIISKDEVTDMGQRDKMTETDIERVRRLYSCDAPRTKTEKESSGIVKEEDAYVPILVHDVTSAAKTKNRGHVSAN